MQQLDHQPTRGSLAGLGLRLPPVARSSEPGTNWGPWTVVPRAKGFHVSREATNDASRTEALTNEVGGTRVFRKRDKAEMAARAANFTQQAVDLARDPLLAPRTPSQVMVAEARLALDAHGRGDAAAYDVHRFNARRIAEALGTPALRTAGARA